MYLLEVCRRLAKFTSFYSSMICFVRLLLQNNRYVVMTLDARDAPFIIKMANILRIFLFTIIILLCVLFYGVNIIFIRLESQVFDEIVCVRWEEKGWKITQIITVLLKSFLSFFF